MGESERALMFDRYERRLSWRATGNVGEWSPTANPRGQPEIATSSPLIMLRGCYHMSRLQEIINAGTTDQSNWLAFIFLRKLLYENTFLQISNYLYFSLYSRLSFSYIIRIYWTTFQKSSCAFTIIIKEEIWIFSRQNIRKISKLNIY